MYQVRPLPQLSRFVGVLPYLAGPFPQLFETIHPATVSKLIEGAEAVYTDCLKLLTTGDRQILLPLKAVCAV